MYWRFFPLTFMDFTPEVVVGVFPHPAELARFTRSSGGVTSSVGKFERAVHWNKYACPLCMVYHSGALTAMVRARGTKHRSRTKEQGRHYRRKTQHIDPCNQRSFLFKDIKDIAVYNLKKVRGGGKFMVFEYILRYNAFNHLLLLLLIVHHLRHTEQIGVSLGREYFLTLVEILGSENTPRFLKQI